MLLCVLGKNKGFGLGNMVSTQGKAGNEYLYSLVNIESTKTSKVMDDSTPQEIESLSDLVTLDHISGVVGFDANSSLTNFGV